MKPCFFLLLASSVWAQTSDTVTYHTDINGRRVVDTDYANTATKQSQVTQSVNGRDVPLEQTTEKVISDSGGVRVTERIVKKFGADGQQASTERVVTEESKTANGSSVKSTIYRSDISGNMKESERRVVDTQTQGNKTTTNTVVDRPTVNGSFEVTEKRAMISEGSDANKTITESVYRRNLNGNFGEDARNVTTVVKNGDKVTETSAKYGTLTGNLVLDQQSTTTTTTRPDGSQVSQIDVYSRGSAGRSLSADAAPQLKEQQIVERRTGPDGSLVETTSVRRASPSDPNKLGSLEKVSETVCTGKCGAGQK